MFASLHPVAPCRRGVVLMSLALLAGRAHGIEEMTAGRSLSLRQGKGSARLVLVVQAPVVAPLPGGTEDPTIHGGSLEISNPETGEWARLGTPASGWSMNALGTVFRFRNPTRGARGVRSAVIRHGRKIKVKASTVGITLDERTQGLLSAALATGNRHYCMLFGGEVRRDEPGKFAARNAPAPTACPQLPAETTTTTTTITRPGRPTTSTVARTPPSSTSTSTHVTTSSSTSSTDEDSTTTTRPSTSSTVRATTSSTEPETTTSTKPPTTSSTARPTTTSTSSTTSTTKKPKKDHGNGMS